MRRKIAYRRLKEILSKRRDALLRVLNHDLEGLREGVGLDIGDEVDEAVDGEFNLVSSQLVQSESRELEQIRDALARLQDGHYGFCEACGEEIPLSRLQALPYATRCVSCQRASERRPFAENSRFEWPEIRDESGDETHLSLDDRVIDTR
jgi:DnaK suppressor protein